MRACFLRNSILPVIDLDILKKRMKKAVEIQQGLISVLFLSLFRHSPPFLRQNGELTEILLFIRRSFGRSAATYVGMLTRI